MYKQPILYGIAGVLLGGIFATLAASYAVNNNNASMMDMMGMDSSRMMHESDMTMSDMTSALKNKTGDEFDKLFISEMINHHQGAIDMASLAKQNAKHDEIKQLADDIIDAQAKEIDQMKLWQTAWGYTTPDAHNSSEMPKMMGH